MFSMTYNKLVYSQIFGLSFAGIVYLCLTSKDEDYENRQPMTKRKALDIILSNMVDEMKSKYPDGKAKFENGLLT